MEHTKPLAPHPLAPAPQAFTAVLVHTDDNNPPQWLVYAVAPAGHSANFSVQVGVLLCCAC